MIDLIGGKLHQWETGRMLTAGDSDREANAIQFANQGDTVALEIEHVFNSENGDHEIRIPDKFLQSGKNLLVYLVKTESSVDSDEHRSQILESKIFPVAAKPRPKTYIPIAAEEALGVVRRLTAAAQEAAQEAEEARVKAEAEKRYAIDAAEAAANARDASVSAKNYAETARKDAEYARDNAIAAKRDAETSANTAETESHNASNEAARAEIFAASAESDRIIASNAAKKAEEDRRASQAFAQEAKAAETNAQTQAKYAESFASAARDEANNAAKYADNSYEFASNAEDAKNTAVSAANTAAKEAADETIQQIEDAVGGSINKIAKIDDNVVGSDAWSSKNIVDKLCPTFKKGGNVVQCEPVEGYPLKIETNSGNKLRFIVCGKNLYNEQIYPLTKHLYVNKDKGTVHEASPDGQNQYAATAESMNKPYYIPVGHLVGEEITLNNTAGGNTPGMAFYNINKVYISGGKGSAITVPDKAAYMLFTVNAAKVNPDGKMEIQVEIGSVATDYAHYGERSKESEKSCELVSFKGINTVFAYDGNDAVKVTVTGRSDPVAIIDKLTKAVVSLGGNI